MTRAARSRQEHLARRPLRCDRPYLRRADFPNLRVHNGATLKRDEPPARLYSALAGRANRAVIVLFALEMHAPFGL